MLYSIVCTDSENSLPKRKIARPAHVERLKKLAAEGRLILAGPNPQSADPQSENKGFSGSIIIAQFDSEKEARQWAGQDPYIEAGVYSKVEIKPFIKVLP